MALPGPSARRKTPPSFNRFSRETATSSRCVPLPSMIKTRLRRWALTLLPTAVFLLGAPLVAHADQITFQYHRFGDIVVDTEKGKENVVIEYSDKDPKNDRTIFKSRLIRVRGNVYRTPKGTLFTLEHLPRPIVNDPNRRINSGDWKLTVSGAGDEFVRLKPQMPKVAFGKTPALVYLGEKAR